MNASMSVDRIKSIVTEVFGLYEQFGSEDYIGEPVSQIEHMSQTAAFALSGAYDDEVVLSAFFHDIGHLCVNGKYAGSMNGFGNKDHERIGAEYLLELGFSKRIAKLVQSHVAAKRYLTYKYPAYYQQLSDASKSTLIFQGGKMTPEEAEEFEKDPDRDLMIILREWDEMAKAELIPISNIPDLKHIAQRHLESRQ